jgi:hypothetical protein
MALFEGSMGMGYAGCHIIVSRCAFLTDNDFRSVKHWVAEDCAAHDHAH